MALQLRLRLQPKSPRAPNRGDGGEAPGPALPAVGVSPLGVASEALSTLSTEEWERLEESTRLRARPWVPCLWTESLILAQG